MDFKIVNPTTINILFRVGVLKLKRDLKSQFEKFPESKTGIKVSLQDVEEKFDLLVADAKGHIEDLIGDMPHISDDDLDDLDSEEETNDPFNKNNYRREQSYNLRSFNNKAFSWMNQTGAYYGGPVLFVYNNSGIKMLVPDAKITHGFDGNSKNYNQPFYFCGTDFKPGDPEYNGKRASIFSAPNSGDTKVTVYFNG